MNIRKALQAPYSERHALAWVLLCYFIIMLDPRAHVTGAIVYMRENYGLYFVAFLTLWFGLGAVFCIFKRLSPLGLVITAVPQWMYTVIGLWLLFKSPTAPLATFFAHFASMGITIYLVRSRIRAIAKGNHYDDDTYHPFAD